MTTVPGNDLVFRRYVPADGGELARLFGEVFTRQDPPHIAVGLSADEFAAFVRIFLPRQETELLTIVARCAESGELAGAMLNDDLASELPEDYVLASPRFAPIDDMLSQLGEEYLGGRTLRRGRYLHLFLLGVSPRFGHRGVAQRLVVESMANAARLGYQRAVVEATNPTSQHIFRTLGFADRVGRSYGEFRHAGDIPFASIADQGGMILMEKRLADD